MKGGETSIKIPNFNRLALLRHEVIRFWSFGSNTGTLDRNHTSWLKPQAAGKHRPGGGGLMVAAHSITLPSSLQQHHGPDHSPLSADRRSSTPRLGGPPSLEKGTSCAAESGGTSPGDRGCGSRGDTDLGLGPCRLCNPLPRGTSGAADLGYHTAAGSLLSTGADLGTYCCGPLPAIATGAVGSQQRAISSSSAPESVFFVGFVFFAMSADRSHQSMFFFSATCCLGV